MSEDEEQALGIGARTVPYPLPRPNRWKHWPLAGAALGGLILLIRLLSRGR